MTGQSRLNFKDERLHVTSSSLNLQRLPANYCFSTGSFALGTQVLINLLLLCEEQKEQRFFRTWGQYSILRNSFQWNFFSPSTANTLLMSFWPMWWFIGWHPPLCPQCDSTRRTCPNSLVQVLIPGNEVVGARQIFKWDWTTFACMNI